MEILIKTYHDGHHEIVIDGKQYVVDEMKSWSLFSESHALSVLYVQCKCNEAKK